MVLQANANRKARGRSGAETLIDDLVFGLAAHWIMSTQRKAKGWRALWEGFIDLDVRALWEPWMIEADRLLEDEELIEAVFEAQGQRHKQSATRGRAQGDIITEV